MKKIPTIFERDWNGDRSRVVDQYAVSLEWLATAVPTRKYDGTCCLVAGGRLFRRREVQANKPLPPDFVTADRDGETGKTVGWVPVGDGPEDQWHRQAWELLPAGWRDAGGTYELVGPNIQGNPEGYDQHILLPHSTAYRWPSVPLDFEGLKEWLSDKDIEGIVWHGPDGNMAKIKLRDFGLKRRQVLMPPRNRCVAPSYARANPLPYSAQPRAEEA